jgi:serine/threonine protein phosphatase PrpC
MIPSERSHLHIAATSHPGMTGKKNEDRFAVVAHRMSPTNPTPSVFAILADGVGGHHAGEVAAEISIDMISNIILGSDASNPLEILNHAIVQAGQKVTDQSLENQVQRGMGSTCACAWIIDDRIYTASVGDSRIYFLRGGQIQQVTTDHTWVQEAIELGIIKPHQARDHPRAHVIRRYLGSRTAVVPDFRLRLHQDDSDQKSLANQGFTLLPKDQILLCSDGLTDLVNDSEIFDLLQNEDQDQAVQSLVNLANERGGHDNITIISLKVPIVFGPVTKSQKGVTNVKGKKIKWLIFLAFSILVIVISALTTVLINNFTQIPTP